MIYTVEHVFFFFFPQKTYKLLKCIRDAKQHCFLGKQTPRQSGITLYPAEWPFQRTPEVSLARPLRTKLVYCWWE